MARPLNSDEQALWGKVIASVQPMHPVKKAVAQAPGIPAKAKVVKAGKVGRVPAPKPAPERKSQGAVSKSPENNLDSHWDRRIGKGAIIPDVSVDLHGQGLSGAYNRLDGALEQAIAQKMRVLLLVTGKARSHDRHSGEGRGAIASVVRDWLAASRHAASISAVRNAHPRHGGAGALYIILKR